jgi:hypothetical protein
MPKMAKLAPLVNKNLQAMTQQRKAQKAAAK